MYEINLCCPVCGGYKFEDTDAGTWICPECNWEGNINEMEVFVNT